MRVTRRKAKPGEVLFFHGRLPGEAPQHLIFWGGQGASKRHANVVLHGIVGERVEPCSSQTRGWKLGQSFLNELEAAGFDTKTLEFSIRVKQQHLPMESSPAEPPNSQEPSQSAASD